MATLTPEQYVEHDGNHCPVCSGVDFSGGAIEIAAGSATQEINCHECGASWVDTYTLTGYAELEQPE